MDAVFVVIFGVIIFYIIIVSAVNRGVSDALREFKEDIMKEIKECKKDGDDSEDKE